MVQVNKLVEECIASNLISDNPGDKEAAKVVFTWLLRGRKAAEKVSPEAVKNLKECGFVDKTGEKLIGEYDKGIGLTLMICGARGFIRQTTKEGR